MGRAPEGRCCICGVTGPLTFEHLPPSSAFNDAPVRVIDPKEAYTVHPLDLVGRKILQRGGGGYTLCSKCNSMTGDWYVKEYTNWAAQAATYLYHSQGEPGLYYNFHGFPLRFIKQVITILLSVAGPNFADRHPHLTNSIRNRRRRVTFHTERLYAYYNPSSRSRKHGVSTLLDVTGGPSSMFVEFAFFPFGFLLSLDSPPPNSDLLDISFLSKFHYDDFTSIAIRMPSFPVISPIPGSFVPMSHARSMRKFNDESR